jgi:hypothetical protein
MSIHEYVVRQQDDGLWGVWLGDRLISGQPNQMAALGVAEALAGAAAARGEPAKILVGELDGEPIEFWASQPGRTATETA